MTAPPTPDLRPKRLIATLQRREDHLVKLLEQGHGSDYVRAEAVALRWAIPHLTAMFTDSAPRPKGKP